MDESQPLLPEPALTNAGRVGGDLAHGKDLVHFDPEGDAENPMDWPKSYKWGVVALLTFMAFNVTATCISVVPIANRIVDDLDRGHASKSASVLLVTIWELGEAAGPLVIAPLSEVVGRYPVMNGCNVLFVAAVVLSALSQSSSLFVGARALTGLAVATNVLNPAVIGDLFPSEQRGSPMSLVAFSPLIGGAIGPAIGGAIAESLGWRAVLWICAVSTAVCELLFLIYFRETYKVTILRRKAARMRKETGNPKLRTIYDEVEDETRSQKFWTSIMRPFVVFAGSGVLQAMSLFGSLVFSHFYTFSTTLPDILEEFYGLSPAETGAVFVVFSVGSAITILICNLYLDRIYVNLRTYHKDAGQPEYRLPLMIIGGFTLPIIVAVYGWVAQYRLPLPLMILTLGMFGVTLMLAFMPVPAYVVDAFGLYAASGMTAVIVTRCLMGTFLPLVATPLVDRFGYGFGMTILGGISLVLAPIPVFIYRYGSVWRQRTKYTRDI